MNGTQCSCALLKVLLYERAQNIRHVGDPFDVVNMHVGGFSFTQNITIVTITRFLFVEYFFCWLAAWGHSSEERKYPGNLAILLS